MLDVEKLWEKAVDFHGHSCPGLALGVVVSKIVLEEFGERAKDEELVAIVENDACGVDAIQTILGCTFGKGNLIHKDYGKSVYTFYNRDTGRAIRLSRKTEVLHREAEEDDKTRRINGILRSGRSMFNQQEVNMLPPKEAKIVDSVICDNCKESTMVTKTRNVNGKKLCIPCYEGMTNKGN